MEVEIAYAVPGQQIIQQLTVPVGSTIAQVLDLSGILQQFPQLLQGNITVGVFGKIRDLSSEVHAEERVEIYRPLYMDPKEARLARIKKKRKK